MREARLGRLAFCAAYNVSSGQQLFGRSSSEQSDHGSSVPAPCGAGEIPASWSNSKNCSVGGTRLSNLNCNSDLTTGSSEQKCRSWRNLSTLPLKRNDKLSLFNVKSKWLKLQSMEIEKPRSTDFWPKHFSSMHHFYNTNIFFCADRGYSSFPVFDEV